MRSVSAGLGLPPELPGFPYADLTERQIWWVATVIAVDCRFLVAVPYKSHWFRALGVLLLIAPHVYGAPQPVDISSAVPAYLASQYATASLGDDVVLLAGAWAWRSAGLWDRMKPETA